MLGKEDEQGEAGEVDGLARRPTDPQGECTLPCLAPSAGAAEWRAVSLLCRGWERWRLLACPACLAQPCPCRCSQMRPEVAATSAGSAACAPGAGLLLSLLDAEFVVLPQPAPLLLLLQLLLLQPQPPAWPSSSGQRTLLPPPPAAAQPAGWPAWLLPLGCSSPGPQLAPGGCSPGALLLLRSWSTSACRRLSHVWTRGLACV